MDAQMLSAAAGIILSLLFSYVPRLNTWYAGQSEEVKKLMMLGLLLITAGGVYGLACAGMLTQTFGVAVTCDKQGALELLQAFILAAIANQTTYKLTPQLAGVKAAKAAAG